MNPAPITMSITPSHRATDTVSPRNIIAAKVANTKLNPVNGQRKLMSLLDISNSRHRKNSASKNTPPRICGLFAPDFTTRKISAPLTPFTSPIFVMPFFSITTPVDSNTRPTNKTKSSLLISQVLVANQFNALFPDRRLHPRADQGIKFVLKFIQRGMRVKLRITPRQPRQQPHDIRLINPRVLQQAEHPVRVSYLPPLHHPPGPAGQKHINERVARAITPAPRRQPRVQPERIPRQPHPLNPKPAVRFHQDAEHRRMQMKMQVPVDVVQRQPRRFELFKLRRNLPTQLLA